MALARRCSEAWSSRAAWQRAWAWLRSASGIAAAIEREAVAGDEACGFPRRGGGFPAGRWRG